MAKNRFVAVDENGKALQIHVETDGKRRYHNATSAYVVKRVQETGAVNDWSVYEIKGAQQKETLADPVALGKLAREKGSVVYRCQDGEGAWEPGKAPGEKTPKTIPST